MTQITIERTKMRHYPGAAQAPCPLRESPLPSKPAAYSCPRCSAPQVRPETTLQQMKFALGQLLTALLTIALSVVRLVRLAIAVALCVVGVVGFGLRRAGQLIVHPRDRKLLPGNGRRLE